MPDSVEIPAPVSTITRSADESPPPTVPERSVTGHRRLRFWDDHRLLDRLRHRHGSGHRLLDRLDHALAFRFTDLHRSLLRREPGTGSSPGARDGQMRRV